MSKMIVEDLQRFLEVEFPQNHAVVEAVKPMWAQIRLPYKEDYLRPGGTVSGPALMTAADTAMYVALMAEIGPIALAVTSNFSINFMRKPAPQDIIAEARIFKIGKHLAFGEILIFSEGKEAPVAQATCTYSIPAGP